jgi:hypothetical protein
VDGGSGIDPRCSTAAGDDWRKVLCSMIVELDDTAAALVATYKMLDMWDNTLMLFSTDNGGMVRFDIDNKGQPRTPASVGSNWPLRGTKMSLFEGGVRGVAFLSGGALDSKLSGTVHRGLTHIVDLTATIATAAGLEFPAPIDGVDIVSAALGTSASRTSVPIKFKETGKNYTAVRFGKWKLIVGSATSHPTVNIPNARLENGWFQNGSYPSVEKPPADETGDIYLFDLVEDPNEHIEVSKVNPDVVAEGRAVLAKYISDGYMNIQPNVPNPLSVYILHNNTWAPFLDTPECVTYIHTHTHTHTHNHTHSGVSRTLAATSVAMAWRATCASWRTRASLKQRDAVSRTAEGSSGEQQFCDTARCRHSCIKTVAANY